MTNLFSKLRRLVCVAISLASLTSVAGTVTYYHNDLLGSPIAATNASGQVIWRESYRPYGERLTNDANSSANRVWFTSRRQDAETGLVYMGARYYDPAVGRFMGRDPKLFDETNPHSLNRYAYANNNPYKYIDRDGRMAGFAVEAGLFLVATGAVVYAVNPKARQAMDRAFSEGLRGLQNILSENKEGSSEEKPEKKDHETQADPSPESPPNPKEFEDPTKIPEGWEWRGKGEPGSREGAYHNPETGESLHDDRTHKPGKDPHWTYTDPNGQRWDNFGDGWKQQ